MDFGRGLAAAHRVKARPHRAPAELPHTRRFGSAAAVAFDAAASSARFALADHRAPAGQLPAAGAGNAHPARPPRAWAAVGGIAGRVVKRIGRDAYAVVCRDALARALYTILALTAVGALAGIV